MVAGNPKVYAQLVQILAPYSKAIKADEPAAAPAAVPETTPEQALAATVAAAPAAKKKGPVRIRKADAARDEDSSH